MATKKTTETTELTDNVETTETVRALLKYHSPAAEIAARNGEETKVIVITARYPKDRVRSICVNNNPACTLPTEEEVEVSVDEYNELRRSMLIRKANKKESDKLEREYRDRKKYL